MYTCVTDYGIFTARNRHTLNKKIDGLLEETDFKCYGPDRIVILTNADIDFIQDRKRLASIPIANLYKKESTQKILLTIILIINIIIMIKK